MHEFDPAIKTLFKNIELFQSLNPTQIDEILSLSKQIKFQPGDQLIKENDVDDNIYVIIDGEIEVKKWDPDTQQDFLLTTLTTKDIIGEISILDNAPRSASAYAKTPVTVIAFSINQLKLLTEQKQQSNYLETSSYIALMQNFAAGLGKRIRKTNEAMIEGLRKELAHLKIQVTMGLTIIVVITNFILYIIALSILDTKSSGYLSVSFINIFLISIFAMMVLSLMIRSGYPPSMYGLTLKNWRSAIKEALIFTLLLMVLTVLCKIALIHLSANYANMPIFQMRLAHTASSDRPIYIASVLIYLLFVPLQELIVRGCLQSLLQEFLIGRFRMLWAILLPNAIFAITHFHLSVKFGLMIFIPGLIWGILYARTRSLIGVTLSHQILGVWGLGIIGFLT